MSSDDHDDNEFPATADALRRTFATVAATIPIRDRSEELIARLEALPGERAGHIDLVEVAPDHPEHRLPSPAPMPIRRHRRLAVAAMLAVLLGGVSLAISLAGDEERPSVKAGPGDIDTGWILPPDGWEVTSVDTDYMDIGENGACPCTTWVAARPGSTPSVVFVRESAVPEDQQAVPSRDIDVGGRPGKISAIGANPAAEVVTVHAAGRALSVSGARIDQQALVRLADAWLDQSADRSAVDVTKLPLPDGFERAVSRETPSGKAWHMILVTARSESTNEHATYQFVPPDWITPTLLSADEVTFDGTEFTGSRAQAGVGPWQVRVGGKVDIEISFEEDGSGASRPSTATSTEYLDGLHEVSTADWRAALGNSQDVDDKVLLASTVTDPPLFVPE